MRELTLNGYIDEDVWFGDEITPEGLHEQLYGGENQHADDVHIRLNSYGGSCNAATRMFDDIRAYPGNVHITVSGTAASAATVLSMAADRLDMTPGSLWMIHDPSTLAWGNEREMSEAIQLLRACKESILNIYGGRCKQKREMVAAMMTATTWMDAGAALENGFIDGVTDTEPAGVSNQTKPRVTDRKEAEAKVQAWLDRHKPQLSRPVKPGDELPSAVLPASTSGQAPETQAGTAQETPQLHTGTPIAQLDKRLGLLLPSRR